MAPNGHDGHGPSVLRQSGTWVAIALVVGILLIIGRQHLAFILGVVIFVVALLVSVMLHELGHFLTAKKFGMKVTQFFVGFGKTLWSTFRGETEYGVKALPFGGFVKITGMTSIEDVDVADEPRSFRNQPGWQRIIVLAAGSFMHFVLALFLLFVLALGIGLSTETNLVSSLIPCVPVSSAALNSAAPCHGATVHSSPAQAAGLRPNDRIITVGGKAVDSFTQLQTVMKSERAGVPLPLLVLRNGHEVHLTVTPAAVPHEASPFLGVESLVTYQGTGVWGAVTFAGSQFGDTITSSVSAIGKLPAAIPDLFAKDRASTPAGQ